MVPRFERRSPQVLGGDANQVKPFLPEALEST
jgi:hypothetical protein